MKRADVDEVLREFDEVVRRAGFTGNRGNYRLVNGVHVKVLLDKFGWDPQLGWGFLLDVTDSSKKDDWGKVPPESRMQVIPYTLQKALGRNKLSELYADNPVLRSRLRSGWFAFDHADRLRALLATVLEPALTHVRAWSETELTGRV
ncbi:hypothetical protein DMH04_09260 [Kibdelosporangium aridum]|uniref:DUF4304 domain-containing protein n=1 Tax=Kibdelosporangium aridum TaxID=2030 RepID=A0A428ZIH0_KIBAR|nr:hypothetical protein [Kibdelosporangium aridum]RSM87903.1 hypothetical protein DMH04_09260 [Kibdelosporangium aridum]